jgi:triosephosphate isomerase
MNPNTREQKAALIKILNNAELDPSTGNNLTCFQLILLILWYYGRTEVVIAPPSIYLISLKEIVRKDIQVAAQNCYFKNSGAFTGEIR